MGQQAFFEAGEKDGVEFEALGAVQSHQRDGDGVVVFVGIAGERGAVEDVFERLALLGGFGHGVGEFAEVFRARGMLEIVLLLDPIEITGAAPGRVRSIARAAGLYTRLAGLRSVCRRNAARR